MASYDEELLAAATLLVGRRSGQRGPLSAARIRRSVSTAYYALFHFVLDESARALIGTQNDLRRRRRTFARQFSHAGIKTALAKVSGTTVEASVVDLLRPPGAVAIGVASPAFTRRLASTFSDAQAQRHDADYDLNAVFDEAGARVLIARVQQAIAAWKAADTAEDRDFKHALCLLMLLKGQLRRES